MNITFTKFNVNPLLCISYYNHELKHKTLMAIYTYTKFDTQLHNCKTHSYQLFCSHGNIVD